MQRAGSRATTAASTGNTHNGRGLHSPGDSSPPGIQFTRGSFSDHLLTLDSPSRPLPKVSIGSRQSQPATATPTPSLLRSPTRKRPPPAPSTAPKPPSSIRSRATAAASSILMPSPPPPASQSSAKVSRQPPSSRNTKESAPPPPTLASNDTLELSVNPVDALARKLRQQAAELTQVYDQMEKKDEDLDRLRGEAKQLNMQIDMQRTKQQRMAVSSRSTVTTAMTATRSAAATTKKSVASPGSPMSGMRNGANRGEASASRAPPPPQHTQEQVEDTREAISRIEEALRELRQQHQDLLSQCGTVEISDLQHEHQLYIRVLEEAVHLKASELCITGHEELLVVLAELRHTIYQQEIEIGELQKAHSSTRSELLECKTLKLETDDKLQRELSRWEQEAAAQRLRETSLQRKLEEVQRLAHSEHMRFRQERASQEQHTNRLTDLENELQLKTQECRKWEGVRDAWAKKESSMIKEIQDLQQTVSHEHSQASRLKEDCNKFQSQVDELNALQEGLLQSIDQFVAKEDAFERRIKALEVEAAATQQLRSENESLTSATEELRQQLKIMDEQSTEARRLAKNWELVEASNAKIIELTKDWGRASQDGSPPGLDPVVRWLEVLQQAGTESLQWLQPFVEKVSDGVETARAHITRVDSECTALQESKRAFEESHTSVSGEVKRLQETLGDAEVKLVQAQSRVEELSLQLSTMEEEVQEARAQLHLQDALAEKIFEQENLLNTQQQRLQSVLLQNAELMALETQFAMQLDERDHVVSELQRRLRHHTEQEVVLREVERELDAAASLTEQQNAWNRQLTEDVERIVWEKAEQEQLREAVEARERIVVSRLTTIFSQYVQFMSANKQRLANEFGVGAEARLKEATRKTVYDEARESGDIIQMLRVFPTLVEEYLASAVLGASSTASVAKKRLAKATTKDTPGVFTISGSRRLHEAKSAPPNNPISEDDLTDSLALQLHEITHAFSKFKSL